MSLAGRLMLGTVLVLLVMWIALVWLGKVPHQAVLLPALVALVIGSMLASFAGRAIARTLSEISKAARTIADGNTPRLPQSAIPELDTVVRALRHLDVQIAERIDHLRRAQAESKAIVESMVEGVLAADARGRVLSANESARRLLGYGPDTRLPDLRQLFRVKPAREIVEAALGGEVAEAREIEIDDLSVMASARPLPTGGVVVILWDVTEVRRLEAVRRDFVANVSHELKTPLTSISGYSETLLAELPDPDTTTRFLNVIHGNARRMQRLVDHLLDLSRIESGRWQPRFEALDLSSIVQDVFDGFQERARLKGVTIESEFGTSSTVVKADEDAVRQVVTNLVDNAIRYTPDGGRILCRTSAEGAKIAIMVRDTGTGISREHLPRIFERFYRADPSRSRDEGGTGLGLAIVKHLVEAHGGRVAAESEWGKGTTITCYFPRPD